MLRKVVALALIAVLALVFGLSPSGAGQQHIYQYTLFNGTQTADSTPQASYWIPLQNANRVVIRLYTQAVAADTATTDSITAWTTQFGDSMQFEAKDSLGTIVTSRSTIFEDLPRSNRFPMILDSTAVSGDGADTTKWVAIFHAPASTNALSFVATKGGWYQFVYPISPAPAANVIAGRLAASQSGLDYLQPSYMRIRYTPKTRLTTAGFSSTAGLRTKGLNKLKAIAYVYKNNE